MRRKEMIVYKEATEAIGSQIRNSSDHSDGF